MRKLALSTGMLILLSTASAAAQTELKLTSGTMQVGGYGTVNFNTELPDGGDAVSGINLSISPQAGYFIIDRLELLAGGRLGVGFGDLFGTRDTVVTFIVGARYYPELGLPVPAYVGADVGMGFYIPDGSIEGAETTKGLELALPLGVLIPLNEHVGLDIGLRVTYALSLQDGGTDALLIPVGYLGVQSFF